MAIGVAGLTPVEDWHGRPDAFEAQAAGDVDRDRRCRDGSGRPRSLQGLAPAGRDRARAFAVRDRRGRPRRCGASPLARRGPIPLRSSRPPRRALLRAPLAEGDEHEPVALSDAAREDRRAHRLGRDEARATAATGRVALTLGAESAVPLYPEAPPPPPKNPPPPPPPPLWTSAMRLSRSKMMPGPSPPSPPRPREPSPPSSAPSPPAVAVPPPPPATAPHGGTMMQRALGHAGGRVLAAGRAVAAIALTGAPTAARDEQARGQPGVAGGSRANVRGATPARAARATAEAEWTEVDVPRAGAARRPAAEAAGPPAEAGRPTAATYDHGQRLELLDGERRADTGTRPAPHAGLRAALRAVDVHRGEVHASRDCPGMGPRAVEADRRSRGGLGQSHRRHTGGQRNRRTPHDATILALPAPVAATGAAPSGTARRDHHRHQPASIPSRPARGRTW